MSPKGLFHEREFQQFLVDLFNFSPSNSKNLDDIADSNLIISKYRENGISVYTYFFREKTIFDLMKGLIQNKQNECIKINIASIGCSSGIDLCSILMLNWDDRNNITLKGYDTNKYILNVAQEGIHTIDKINTIQDLKCAFYQALLLKTVPADVRKSVYTEKGSIIKGDKIYTFSREFMNCISFQQHDIFEGPLPEKADIILLMNLLYYYSPKQREKILSNVHNSMKQGDVLICETADSKLRSLNVREYIDWMDDISKLGFVRLDKEQYPNLISNQRVYSRR